MMNHFMMFSTEAAARAALSQYGAEHDGVWSWDQSRVISGQRVVLARAVWDYSNPESPVLQTPEQTAPGYFLTVSLDKIDPALRDSPACRVVSDNDNGWLYHAAPDLDATQLATAIVEPIAAGQAKSFAQLTQWVADEAVLGPIRKEYKAKVDADAEACRLQYITPGDGMAMTYAEKFAQAQGVQAMGQAAATAMTQAEREAQFPTLSASVGIEAPTLWECAERVLTAYAAFAQLSLVIERTRLQGKASISAASDEAAIIAAYEALTWPTP